MSATEWIAQRRELLDAATEEPWYATDGINWGARVATSYYDLADVRKTSDAKLIADARTSLPTALDALDAVLGLWPDADPCPPRSCTHVDCEVINAIEAVLGGGDDE